MNFKDFRTVNEATGVPKDKDPPMILQLRRQAIRNFPGGKRVALFTNPQLNISIAVPYDTATGNLVPSNIQKEAISHDDYGSWEQHVMSRGGLNFKYQPPIKGYGPDDETHRGHTIAYDTAGNMQGVWDHKKSNGVVSEDFRGEHFGDYLDHLTSGNKEGQKSIEDQIRASNKSFEHFHQAALAYHEGDMRAANKHWRKYIKEDTDDDSSQAKELCQAYDILQNKKEHSDLERALFNWLSSEIEEHGEFEDMDGDTLDDVYSDYKALTSEANVTEANYSTGGARKLVMLPGRTKASLAKMMPRQFTSFADWHDHAERRGGTDVEFKIHNAGGSTSAFMHGKKLGTFDHSTKTGHIQESAIHHLNRIVRIGQEDEVKFANGESARVHPVTAKAVVDLYNKVNDGNQRKVSEMINSGKAGMNKVADFAMEALKRGNT